MTYEKIYSRFLSRITDKSLYKLSNEDFHELMKDYLYNSISTPHVRKIFESIKLDDEIEELTFTLVNSIDESSDEQFVIEVLTQALVIQWMTQKIDTDLTLAVAIGGKEEKVLKNNLKENQERLKTLKSELQKTIRNQGYYNGTYTV